MPLIEHFHETRFPLDIAIGAIGGPTRRTEIVSLVSGHEKRNTKWAHSKRNYNAGFGIKTIDDLQDVIAFFEERRGRLYGFRFRDPLDNKSCKTSNLVAVDDQEIGLGDGQSISFQLRKLYGQPTIGHWRDIQKPIADSVLIAVDGSLQMEGVDYTLDDTNGEIGFLPASVPSTGATITAGFEFDVAVRFETDEIAINLNAFKAGEIPSIPLIEIKS